MLEPYVLKGTRTVLRGEGGSNIPDLPDHNYKYLADANPAYNFNIAKFLKKEKRSGKEVRKGLTKANAKIDRIIISKEKPLAKPQNKQLSENKERNTAATAKSKP